MGPKVNMQPQPPIPHPFSNVWINMTSALRFVLTPPPPPHRRHQPTPPPLHASIVLISMTSAKPTKFILVRISTLSIVHAILVIVVIGLKIRENKYTCPNFAHTFLSFLVLITRDANLHHHLSLIERVLCRWIRLFQMLRVAVVIMAVSCIYTPDRHWQLSANCRLSFHASIDSHTR